MGMPGTGESAPCATDTLRLHRIPYTYWYEYALRHYGSKTIVFSLYLLVNSVRDAKTCLESAGWTSGNVPMYTLQYHDPATDEQAVLEYPGVQGSTVVLMCARTWTGITPSDAAEDAAHYPALLALYTALAQRSLDTDTDAHRRYLQLQLGYLHMDCPAVATPGFLASLPPDIQQLHVDFLSNDMRMGTARTLAHERDIRDRARRGEWTLMPQGSVELGGTPVDHELEAKWAAEAIERVRALYPDAGTDEGEHGEEDEGEDGEEGECGDGCASQLVQSVTDRDTEPGRRG
ncbi:hypothetical protein C8T65DRAFT_610370 [Cerioporus squamosus]|nr:hypothetical protein C8T65DRAFT_610370 [Cerioporus squamosus]